MGSLQLELTVDILTDEWVDVPIGLGGCAISGVRFVEPVDAAPSPLLRVANGQYILTTKGKGRYVLAVDFVSQLETKPGLNVLGFKLPSAAITTLELVISEENMKVDVKPMLAATTTQIEVGGTKSRKLQAFLGSAKEVNLSWKPTTQAAEEMEAVVVCRQFQHIDIGEGLITYDIKLDYSIHRGGTNAFAARLPSGFRVMQVTGANISKWDVKIVDAAPALKLNIRPLKSRLALETFVGLNVRPTVATYTYRLRYTISGSPVDVLTFGMDSRYAKLSVVQSRAMRSVAKRQAEGLTMWDLSLINEVTGVVDVVVNFSVPLDGNTKSLPVPPIVCDCGVGRLPISRSSLCSLPTANRVKS